MNSTDRSAPPKSTQSLAMTLREVAQMLDGHLQVIENLDRPSAVDELENLTVSGAAPPNESTGHDVTMIDQLTKVSSLVSSHAVAVITPAPISLPEEVRESYHGPLYQIVVKNVHAAMTTIVEKFRPAFAITVPVEGIDPSAVIDSSSQIHSSATIGEGVVIGPNCRIFPNVTIAGGCVIGADCVLYPGVALYPYTRLGDRVILHAGTVIGANGFGYRTVNGRHLPTAQLGYVAIESDVEIGACVTVDRGTYGATRIGEGTKIDNQVMIGHNCQIGKHNLLCSQVGIAGSCRTGDYVVLAGQVGLKDHINLGDAAVVGAQAGVMEDLEGGNVYLGSPATTQRDQMQIMAVQRRLPDMRRELRRLDKAVAELTQQIQQAESTSRTRHAA